MRPIKSSLWLLRLGLAWLGLDCGVGLAAELQSPVTCPPQAQLPSPAQLEEGTRSARDRGFLWKASKDGRTSFLYGTIHVGKLEWTFPGPAVLEAIRSTGVIALELDVLDPEQARALQEGIGLKPDRRLPEALNERLRKQLQAACLPESLLTVTSPEVIATTLTVLSGRGEGLDPAYAIDAVYASMGRALGKPVASLETPAMQLKLLLGASSREIEEAVTSALDDLESGKAGPMLTKMARVWADGRLAELENYGTWCACLDSEQDRATMRRLLDERNPGLAVRIDALHSSGKTVFAAVGSLHMIGSLGLPALLAQRGYKVERVDFKP